MPSPHLTLSAFRIVFFAVTAGGASTSVLLSGAVPRLLLWGAAVGVLLAILAWVLSRYRSTRDWVVIPTVMVLSAASRLTAPGEPGSALIHFFQFGGTALAIYGVGLVLLRIAVMGTDAGPMREGA